VREGGACSEGRWATRRALCSTLLGRRADGYDREAGALELEQSAIMAVRGAHRFRQERGGGGEEEAVEPRYPGPPSLLLSRPHRGHAAHALVRIHGELAFESRQQTRS
jgi:hypothetical protein